ncbi:hypothetical protein CONPUDRAFT_154181 [Coniophora puteana RWD-64-598 SS2]|uniref:Uncharacterized protein n=1 Tax=Coniophora puteana (strain RWD-64-598) TaxID=741705 RepID=A0A5M3MR62_CONPW|nr:uncharacterized protein CONPUDRAFT_154181 [Coniophora puteana RWD-64-598 SS2]EIW81649.1 hypothetical protein CONPUDRAFT_154181 [Coniophora puteana RWD-64-598 SS2]
MLNLADDSRSPVGARNGDFIFEHRVYSGDGWTDLNIIVKQYHTEAEIEREHAALLQTGHTPYNAESLARFAVADQLTYLLPEPRNIRMLRECYPTRLFCIKPRVVIPPRFLRRGSPPIINNHEPMVNDEVDVEPRATSPLCAEPTLVENNIEDEDDIEYVRSSSADLPPLAVLIDRIMCERREQNTIIIDDSDDSDAPDAHPVKRLRGSTSDDAEDRRGMVDAHLFDVFASAPPRHVSLPPHNQLVIAAQNILRTEFGDLEPIEETSDVNVSDA